MIKKIFYGALANSITIVFVSWLSVLLVGRIFDFHQMYIKFIDQINSEKWLLEQCQQDHFFHNMAYHTDVCTQVLTNSKTSPILYSINASMAQLKMCGFYDCFTFMSLIYQGGMPAILCLVLVYVLTPSFLIPWMHIAYNKHEQRRFDIQCSPQVPKKRTHKLMNNVEDSRSNTWQ
jgi:hypothetical protein